ncbi:MAG TPA: GGDEF domain-containing protein [Actinomycetales bacterium]|nr:GGDEF domain-containing protein [Actinomycetales bacterium]
MNERPEAAPEPLQALADLAHAMSSTARFEDVLALAAEEARRALDADGLSLSRWERDRGVLRTLVNAGLAADPHGTLPTDESYPISEYAEILDFEGRGGVVYQRGRPCPEAAARMLDRLGQDSLLSVQVTESGRQWGELVATRTTGPAFGPEDLPRARQVAGIVGDVVTHAEQLQRLSRLAFQDPLTGVANRRVLDDTLAAWLGPDGPGATVVLCDVNGLKQVNDSEGHEAGDRAIVAVADALAHAAAGLEDFVLARIGGDEFAVLLPGPARTVAVEVVEATAGHLEAAGRRTTVSCGVATGPVGTEPRGLLNAADDAQYAAKRRGAQVVIGSVLDSAISERLPRPRWVAPARRFRRDDGSAVTLPDALAALAEGASDGWAELDGTPAAALRWLGERLLAPCHLDRWNVSRVNAAGRLETVAMGLRRARGTDRSARDLMVDTHVLLEDYPLTAHAVATCAVFVVDSDDEAADEAERALLARMGVQYVVGLGVTDGEESLLLELHGDRSGTPAVMLADLMVVAATAVLRRPVGLLTGVQAPVG